MKMKEVCKTTGLTDRTVRFYIESGLLSPANRESHTGRRSYTFSEDDVATLEKIKVLRNAGFSVEQIKRLQTDRRVSAVVNERIEQLQAEQERGRQIQETLQKADIDREVSFEELMIILQIASDAHEPRAIEEPTDALPWRRRLPFVVTAVALVLILAVAWVSMLLIVFGVLPRML